MTVACDKLKFTFPKVVIRGGSGTAPIPQMKLFAVITLHWKPLKVLTPFSKNWRSMQNLKHTCYEIPNSSFNDKQKRTKLEATTSPLSKIVAGRNSIYK